MLQNQKKIVTKLGFFIYQIKKIKKIVTKLKKKSDKTNKKNKNVDVPKIRFFVLLSICICIFVFLYFVSFVLISY